MNIYVNGESIFGSKFGGGECHVNVNTPITERTKITAYLRNSDDIMLLLLTVDAIKRINHETKINLFIPYFPYARQDRVCQPGEPLSVSVMAGIINSLGCDHVVIVDPHSDVCSALIDRCRIISQRDIAQYYMPTIHENEEKICLVSPDSGAEKKTREISECFGLPVIFCTKERDLKSGKINGVRVPEFSNGQVFIVVDDICDGGRTFVALAEALKEKGAGDLYLYVTQGIFSLDRLFL